MINLVSGEISFDEFHVWFLSEGEFRNKAIEEERKAKRMTFKNIQNLTIRKLSFLLVFTARLME